MNDHGIDADLFHQDNIPCEAIESRAVTHGVPAHLDDDPCPIITLQIGQCLGQRSGGRNPVSIHCVLSGHCGHYTPGACAIGTYANDRGRMGACNGSR